VTLAVDGAATRSTVSHRLRLSPCAVSLSALPSTVMQTRVKALTAVREVRSWPILNYPLSLFTLLLVAFLTGRGGDPAGGEGPHV
jgi:hypothetical protein